MPSGGYRMLTIAYCLVVGLGLEF